MISATQWEAYNKAVAKITDEAKDATSKQLASWLAEHDATVAEARAAAQRILAANAELYSQQAAALAAEWYDAQGKATGMKLDRAVTSVTVDRDSLSKTVRYQAQKLIDGDVGGFCDAVGEWAENEAKRALNATIMANAKRDRRKGVRFARVTSGRNTCGFCLLLAGRGAIYHTRQSAGELGQYHRHCSCKIVPSYTGNQYEVLVEGHDPKKIENRLIEVENQTGTARGTADFHRVVSLRDPDWLLGGEAKADYSLNPIENYGTLSTAGDYSPESITNKGTEWRDLWAHHVLEQHGISPVAHGGQDIDLTINGEWWEIKSPEGREAESTDLRFIERCLRKAKKQFDKRGIAGECRVVFNTLYREPVSEEFIFSELKSRATQHGVKEVLYISSSGALRHFK